MIATKTSLVSILIPTYNRENYLAQTIDSALAQDYSHLEVIVSDNASTDGTTRLVQKYAEDRRFRYHRNDRNIGLVPNHKKAIEIATGEYFMILSDDDYLVDKDYISKAIALFENHPELVMVYAQGYILNVSSKTTQKLILPFREVETGKTIFLSRGTVKPLDFILCNVLFRTEIARSLNPYTNEHNMSSDSELFLMMCLKGYVGVIKDFVSVYRIHPRSITKRIRKDENLMVHNLDYLIEPYKLAKSMNVISADELSAWEKRHIISEIKRAILMIVLYHKETADIALQALSRKAPDIYRKIINNLEFRIQFSIAKKAKVIFFCISGSYRREVLRDIKNIVSRKASMSNDLDDICGTRERMLPISIGGLDDSDITGQRIKKHESLASEKQTALRYLERIKIPLFNRWKKFWSNIRNLGDTITTVQSLQEELDTLRSRMDIDRDLIEAFQYDRLTPEYQSVYGKKSPLITVCVGTYNRARLLVDRSLKSILGQDYRNLEVIVVGDCCADDTVDLVSKIHDSRLRFINLPERGRYPEDPRLRWMVAGTIPFNNALSMAIGDFITHLDDDDEYTPDRISRLVAFIQQTKADLVWHPFWTESNKNRWAVNKAERYARTMVTTSCVMYHRWFKRIPWDLNAYQYREPGDWNRFRKFMYLGAKIEQYPVPLLKHYRERNQP